MHNLGLEQKENHFLPERYNTTLPTAERVGRVTCLHRAKCQPYLSRVKQPTHLNSFLILFNTNLLQFYQAEAPKYFHFLNVILKIFHFLFEHIFRKVKCQMTDLINSQIFCHNSILELKAVNKFRPHLHVSLSTMDPYNVRSQHHRVAWE